MTTLRRPRPRSRVMNRGPLVTSALCFLVLLLLIAVFSPLLTPHDPNRQDLVNRLTGPTSGHWLGTDSVGRDNLSRLIIGTRLTAVAVAQAVGLAALLGVPLGLFAGFMGKTVDGVFGWISDTILSMPPLFLALAIVGILGPGLTNAMLALGFVFAPGFFRVARASAISIRNQTYIEAARSIGWTTPQIVWRHILPNSSGPILVQITFTIGITVLAEASLSFLGLGARPPDATWGGMLNDAFDNIYTGSFALFPPSIMIILTILSSALVSDSLRDSIARRANERS